MKLQAWAILGSISTDSRAQCVHVFLAVFFWFLQWFRIVVVFLLGLHASARMTACCACLGVGFTCNGARLTAGLLTDPV